MATPLIIPENSYAYYGSRTVLVQSWERFWNLHYLDEGGKRRKLSICAAPEQTREEVERHAAALNRQEGRDWRLLGVVEGKLLPV